MPVRFDTVRDQIELGYLSPHDPSDRRAFSGTSFYAARALAAHPGINLRVLNRRHGYFRRPDNDAAGLDAVVGLAATPQLDALMARNPGLPVLHVTDATPRFLRDAYGWDIPEEADQREVRVAFRAAATIYSSPEMAARARDDLGLPGLTPLVQPFGLNFESLPPRRPKKAQLSPLKLLFVGIDWHRKGGDIAVQFLDLLREAGVDATLTIIGKPPKHIRGHPGVQVAGYLDKNRPVDRAELIRLYKEAHLLLLPSRADCTPMAVAEALAHGTPVICSRTGGIASLLGPSGAGLLLEPGTRPETWSKVIRRLTASAEIYRAMSQAAFDRAQHGLSWGAWAERIHDIAREIRAPRATGTDAA